MAFEAAAQSRVRAASARGVRDSSTRRNGVTERTSHVHAPQSTARRARGGAPARRAAAQRTGRWSDAMTSLLPYSAALTRLSPPSACCSLHSTRSVHAGVRRLSDES